MRKADSQKEKEIELRFRDTQLSAEILRMNRQSGMIKRTANAEKIARFNQLFFAKIKELTDIRSKLGRTDRDEVVQLIKKWKGKN